MLVGSSAWLGDRAKTEKGFAPSLLLRETPLVRSGAFEIRGELRGMQLVSAIRTAGTLRTSLELRPLAISETGFECTGKDATSPWRQRIGATKRGIASSAVHETPLHLFRLPTNSTTMDCLA